MSLAVQLTYEAARSVLGQEGPGGEAGEVLRAVEALGIRLEPMHPGATDRSGMTWFKVDVADRARGQAMADRLLKCKGVEAAYYEPPVEPAGPPAE